MGRFILRIMQRKVGTTEHMFSIHVCVCAYSVISDALHIHGLGVAKSLQSCPTLCDPIDGNPLGSPFPGILQARTLSGLPFPSPMHESESEVAQSCQTLRNPMDCSLLGSSIHGIFQARILEWVVIAFKPYRPLKSNVKSFRKP